MPQPTEPGRYHIYLDYAGYQIDDRSYRVFPAPLMGTRFATGRMAYSNLDFWQVGAMTDFTKGINQKFLVDPSQYYNSVGIDVSKEGEFKLEKDLVTQAFPGAVGYITARYRSANTLWLGTSTGHILKMVDIGAVFTDDKDTGSGRIYDFYEMEDDGIGFLYATKGKDDKTWRKEKVQGLWEECDGSGGKPDIEGLYYVMVESDYAFGIFNDGVRQSTDGKTWIPEPPDPLWELPNSEGEVLNAKSIPRGFLIGAIRGLWIFIGGGSATNLWLFPEYANVDNFSGMDKWGPYGIFSVEDQGLFYTDGAGIYPTNLNWQEEPMAIIKCKSILTSGWDIFALVSDGTGWYLARCSMKNSKLPSYFWLIKKLSKTPSYLSSFSRKHVFIHYADGTCQKYNRVDGPYQTSGYLESSLIDENLVLLQKQYKDLSALLTNFPTNTTVKIGYRLGSDSGAYTEESFAGDSQFSKTFDLANPTLSTRIQIKITLETTSTSVSPVVSDLCWKYILERPASESTRKKNFSFTILAEDELEKLDMDKEELELTESRTREQIVQEIWSVRDKQELLNFVGADNVIHSAFIIRYVGTGTSCRLKIDQTNRQLILTVDDVVDQTIPFKNVLIRNLVTTLDVLSNYQCTEDLGLPQNQSAHTLMPVNDVEIKGEALIYYGTDVYPVIFNPQAPAQFKMVLEGRGSDRLNISLREA